MRRLLPHAPSLRTFHPGLDLPAKRCPQRLPVLGHRLDRGVAAERRCSECAGALQGDLHHVAVAGASVDEAERMAIGRIDPLPGEREPSGGGPPDAAGQRAGQPPVRHEPDVQERHREIRDVVGDDDVGETGDARAGSRRVSPYRGDQGLRERDDDLGDAGKDRQDNLPICRSADVRYWGSSGVVEEVWSLSGTSSVRAQAFRGRGEVIWWSRQ